MELSLAANIREYRKKHGLTQEQLADAMGVTAGAVYKWEAGLSVPELELIVRLSYFFDVSVDALLGCKPLDNRLDAMVRRLKEYCVKADPHGVIEAEASLGKYPNSFEVVYYSAELMMSHNDGGIFSDAAGLALAMFCGRCEEAEPYLTDAMRRLVWLLANMVGGCIFVYRSREDWGSARDMLIWSIELLSGLKNTAAVCFIDKIISEFLSILACAHLRLGNKEQALDAMRKAAETAMRFDAHPEYCMNNIRFTGRTETVRINDVLGTTAAESIENILGLLGDSETLSMWHGMSKESQ